MRNKMGKRFMVVAAVFSAALLLLGKGQLPGYEQHCHSYDVSLHHFSL